jgi:hypothetical protein
MPGNAKRASAAHRTHVAPAQSGKQTGWILLRKYTENEQANQTPASSDHGFDTTTGSG